MANFLRSATDAATEPKNWKAAASGIGTVFMAVLTVISQISYDQGPISLVIPVEYKPTVTWIAGAATLLLGLYSEYQKALIRNDTEKQLKRRH